MSVARQLGTLFLIAWCGVLSVVVSLIAAVLTFVVVAVATGPAFAIVASVKLTGWHGELLDVPAHGGAIEWATILVGLLATMAVWLIGLALWGVISRSIPRGPLLPSWVTRPR